MATQPILTYERAVRNAHIQQHKYQLQNGWRPPMVIVVVTLRDEAEPRFRVYQQQRLAVSLKKAEREIESWELIAWVSADGTVTREEGAHYWDDRPPADEDNKDTPPAWVQDDPVCLRIWQEDVSGWRECARAANDHPETQHLLKELASRASGGSQGEATQKKAIWHGRGGRHA